jgi:16S rRNA (adenine1518-N6/adenine1519-N6)-dimethyltransferase
VSIDADLRAEAPSAILKSAGVRPSKARGQNFLVQRTIAEHIVANAEICADDDVLEIGPGLGILSEAILAAAPRHLTLVELDSRLAEGLATRFDRDARITLINRDFLKLESIECGRAPFKVLGNLPFNVAAAILRRLSDNRGAIARMVLMFQREVGERIRARPGSSNYAALSAFTALYWHVGAHFRVAAGSFHPRPKVDAEVLTIEPLADVGFEPDEERAILTTVRAVFSAPRKTVRNSLIGGLRVGPGVAERALQVAGIVGSARPATLGRAELIALARALNPEMRNGRA